MEVSTLNLARKWRSQTFDTLIGQDIVVKILKNSLYTSYYFPVYLFSGQRGCGKTSTARIFAAALNCLNLKKFQEKPKEVMVPCGVCQSCEAMHELRHPDFIEIDAASHTGVDNMRSIIDSAYYLPVLGYKKIYLIDEAHMLSKAAFNALLKVLEEPPTHAHFILATTDSEKIIETVKSRCFILFFDAIDYTVLANHLEHVCKQERIQYTYEALIYIAQCAQGSARDAINMLEMIRFSYTRIDKSLVLNVLGHIDDQRLADFLQYIARGEVQSFLTHWNDVALQRISMPNIWSGFLRVARAMLWYHYGIQSVDLEISIVHSLKTIEQSFFKNFLHELYNIEPLFIRTTDPHGILNFVLLDICSRRKKKIDVSSNNNQSGMPNSVPTVSECLLPTDQNDDCQEESDDFEPLHKNERELDSLFLHFKAQLNILNDPVLISLLSQVISIKHDIVLKSILVQFSVQHKFFADKLHETASIWHSFIQDIYKTEDKITISFDGSFAVESVQKKTVISPISSSTQSAEKQIVPSGVRQEQKQYTQGTNRYKSSVQEKKIDISDIQRWPLTNRVLDYFPGTVTVVDEAKL